MAGIHPQLKEEIWAKCERFPNYEVSSYGRVRNTRWRGKYERMLKPRIQNPRGGYVVVLVDEEGKSHTKMVARLVAEAFIPNEHGAVEVVHIGSKLDDSVENLQWRTLAPQSEIEGERWADIEGYEGRYQISDHGRVRSLSYNQSKRCVILKANKGDSEYLSIGLYDGGGRRHVKRFYIHRLVAQHFVPNPDNLETVNHKDENPKNNVASNLEWVSQRDNNLYGGRLFRAGHSKGNRLNQRSLDGRYIRTFDSAADVERKLGFNRQVISRAAASNGVAYGYRWQIDKLVETNIVMPIIRV